MNKHELFSLFSYQRQKMEKSDLNCCCNNLCVFLKWQPLCVLLLALTAAAIVGGFAESTCGSKTRKRQIMMCTPLLSEGML